MYLIFCEYGVGLPRRCATQEGPIGTKRKEKKMREERKTETTLQPKLRLETKLWARVISLLTRTIVQLEDSRGGWQEMRGVLYTVTLHAGCFTSPAS